MKVVKRGLGLRVRAFKVFWVEGFGWLQRLEVVQYRGLGLRVLRF